MRVALVLVTYSILPERLLASVPRTTHQVSWYVAHHGSEPELSTAIGDAVAAVGGDFVPHNYNRGLSRSWNDGIKRAIDDRADMILLVNDDLHFYEGGFDKFIAFSAEQFANETIGMTYVTGYETDGDSKGITRFQGFACCAMAPQLIERIGYFDQNFFPAYYEDIDYFRRMQLAGLAVSTDPRCLVEHARSSTVRNDPELQAVHVRNYSGVRNYFLSKWGGDADETGYPTPFNDPTIGPKIEFDRRAAPFGPGRDRVPAQ